MNYANSPTFPRASEGAVDRYLELAQDMTPDECTELRDRAEAICKAQGKRLLTSTMNQQAYDEMMASHQQRAFDWDPDDRLPPLGDIGELDQEQKELES